MPLTDGAKMTKSLSISKTDATDSASDREGFKQEFFKDLYELESSNFWFRNRNRLITWALRKFFPRAKNFLEIGCGTGFVLMGINAAIPHLELCGSELFENGLSFAKKRLPHTKLIRLDARDLQLSETFDVIGAFDVIEHIDEDVRVLEQMYIHCRQGIILTVPQHPWLWSHLDEVSCHKRRYSRDELVKKVEAAGFDVKFVTSFVFLLLPIMLLSRLRKRAPGTFNATDELKLPIFVNKLLEAILLFEKILIGTSVKLPVGGSLLLIAYKSVRPGDSQQS